MNCTIVISYRVRCFVGHDWQERPADNREHALSLAALHNRKPNDYTKGKLSYALAITPKGKRVKIGKHTNK